MKNRLPKPNETETVHRLARITKQVEDIRQQIENEDYGHEMVAQFQAACKEFQSMEINILQKHVTRRKPEAMVAPCSPILWGNAEARFIPSMSC